MEKNIDISTEVRDYVKFTYEFDQSLVRVTTPAGLKFQLESFTSMQGRTGGGVTRLRLRKANKCMHEHVVNFKFSSSDFPDLNFRRTLVFSRGVYVLNLQAPVADLISVLSVFSKGHRFIDCELTARKSDVHSDFKYLKRKVKKMICYKYKKVPLVSEVDNQLMKIF
ncbi:hypothetical protein CEXT_214111 [Caerostris extrusa]|uniref:Uncharacterized protein n=1 Tax=Caerostris extrusa TaxID=172846 RepID=A0AAV4Y800_CAEEX|nr:hypothetical protein CEXT_214111 [Caerostris extrusa]